LASFTITKKTSILPPKESLGLAGQLISPILFQLPFCDCNYIIIGITLLLPNNGYIKLLNSNIAQEVSIVNIDIDIPLIPLTDAFSENCQNNPPLYFLLIQIIIGNPKGNH
jgi:hypothetical protein